MQYEPQNCSECNAGKKYLVKKGIGTQQVVSILQKLFPNAKIERADLDATINRKKWQNVVKNMHEGNCDILVGTQTITKGYHFPQVTLVGILWADVNLSFPVYNAAEITLAQLIQVAGRAGRFHKDSLVIVQTMLKHPIYQYLNEMDYTRFYEREINYRIELKYPPIYRFAEIEIRNGDENFVEHDAALAKNLLNQFFASRKSAPIILGPAKPPVHKIKNTFMRKIYIKHTSMIEIQDAFYYLQKYSLKSMLFFTPQPVQ